MITKLTPISNRIYERHRDNCPVCSVVDNKRPGEKGARRCERGVQLIKAANEELSATLVMGAW